MSTLLTMQSLLATLSAWLLFSCLLLLLSKKLSTIVSVFAGQSLLLAIAIAFSARYGADRLLYLSALLTLLLKVWLIPRWLRRWIAALHIPNILSRLPSPVWTLCFSVGIIFLCYLVIAPMPMFSSLVVKNSVAIAMSVTLLGVVLMVMRNHALTHVIGFMVMENGIFFFALLSTHGMPMMVELGIAFDLLVAVILFGVFFFHIRNSIESMNVDSLNALREDIA